MDESDFEEFLEAIIGNADIEPLLLCCFETLLAEERIPVEDRISQLSLMIKVLKRKNPRINQARLRLVY
ncbi:hypothetical protein [Paenibacillus sp. FSL R7-0128]|uniref:hypothetical protein n=1 Tax=Paenibacillus sp. FSL R7-0128 TaxID=2954529 RepID=UPI0030F59E0B